MVADFAWKKKKRKNTKTHSNTKILPKIFLTKMVAMCTAENYKFPQLFGQKFTKRKSSLDFFFEMFLKRIVDNDICAKHAFDSLRFARRLSIQKSLKGISQKHVSVFSKKY